MWVDDGRPAKILPIIIIIRKIRTTTVTPNMFCYSCHHDGHSCGRFICMHVRIHMHARTRARAHTHSLSLSLSLTIWLRIHLITFQNSHLPNRVKFFRQVNSVPPINVCELQSDMFKVTWIRNNVLINGK